MDRVDDVEQLKRDVAFLKDRLAIQDVIARHAHGHDRHDSEVLTDVYHADGIDEHGHAINAGPAYAEWSNRIHAGGSDNHLHNLSTHVCEIDGDTAHAESYVMVFLLDPGGKTARIINGRYVDRLEKRDGAWRILLRRATVEVLLQADASILSHPRFIEQGYIKGRRDRDDVSYRRPLSRDDAVDRW
ncbi:MAG: nuclear transport factor 2 family protein [Sphingomonas sp.]